MKSVIGGSVALVAIAATACSSQVSGGATPVAVRAAEPAAPVTPTSDAESSRPEAAATVASESATGPQKPATEEYGPSCQAGLSCADTSCCERGQLPAGSFDKRRDDGASRETTVTAFALDRFEVTVGRIKAWVDAGQKMPKTGAVLMASSPAAYRWTGREPVQTGEGLKGWRRYDTWARASAGAGEASALPKNNVNWYTAAAFCDWDGGRLPTETELKYAAYGGNEQRAYPWGNAPATPKHAIYNCTGDGARGCSAEDIPAVGSRPAGRGRWGHDDLVGSLFEWTADQISRPGAGVRRSSRGGGFCFIGGIDKRSPISRVSIHDSREDSASTVSHTVGFRCAYDEDPADAVQPGAE